jgi:hypothetical protein
MVSLLAIRLSVDQESLHNAADGGCRKLVRDSTLGFITAAVGNSSFADQKVSENGQGPAAEGARVMLNETRRISTYSSVYVKRPF